VDRRVEVVSRDRVGGGGDLVPTNARDAVTCAELREPPCRDAAVTRAPRGRASRAPMPRATSHRKCSRKFSSY